MPSTVCVAGPLFLTPRVGRIGRVNTELVDRLRAAGCVAPEEEARELLATTGGGESLAGAIARRERGEPLAWITGSVEFCGRRLHVAPGVYVPRVQSEE